MMIKRTELIEKIRTKIEEREQHAANAFQQAVIKADVNQAEYVERTRAAWHEFSLTIRRRVRRGEPVTIEDVPDLLRTGRGWGQQPVELFKADEVKESNYVPHLEGFRSLLLVLESSPDELVSTSALERMGAPVKELFR